MITHKQCFVACLLLLPLPLLMWVNPALTTLWVFVSPAGVCSLLMGQGRPSHSLAFARCVDSVSCSVLLSSPAPLPLLILTGTLLPPASPGSFLISPTGKDVHRNLSLLHLHDLFKHMLKISHLLPFLQNKGFAYQQWISIFMWLVNVCRGRE